jgi:hypothetical protein
MSASRLRFAVAAVGLCSGVLAAFVLAAAGDRGAALAAPAAETLRDASAPDAAPARPPISRTPPDPSPMRERAQWIFDLRWAKGDAYLVGVHKIEQPMPQETPRAMGRFALELFEGPTLIERVRFDFPLLGDEPRDGGSVRPVPYFGKNLVTRIGVMFPATSRGTKLQLWDRATDKRWELPWPPVESTDGPDAGTPSNGGKP